MTAYRASTWTLSFSLADTAGALFLLNIAAAIGPVPGAGGRVFEQGGRTLRSDQLPWNPAPMGREDRREHRSGYKRRTRSCTGTAPRSPGPLDLGFLGRHGEHPLHLRISGLRHALKAQAKRACRPKRSVPWTNRADTR